MCVWCVYAFVAFMFVFFFFKQKTAYEMRISDWSSDVCSSDLHPGISLVGLDDFQAIRPADHCRDRRESKRLGKPFLALPQRSFRLLTRIEIGKREKEIGRASCRERVCKYV